MPKLTIEGLETRMAVGGLMAAADSTRIRGMAIVFHSLSENLGGFREMIAPEAVDRTLRQALDVRALIDHDASKILGRTTAGTLRLDKRNNGLEVTIDPPETTVARDILESIRRGDVTGMSFGFRTIEDKWNMDTTPPTRTVLDMEVHDVSVVTYPAYPQTDVAVRSLRDFRHAWEGSEIAKLRAKLAQQLPWQARIVQEAVQEAEKCPSCRGAGLKPERYMGDPQGQETCPDCQGSGKKQRESATKSLVSAEILQDSAANLDPFRPWKAR